MKETFESTDGGATTDGGTVVAGPPARAFRVIGRVRRPSAKELANGYSRGVTAVNAHTVAVHLGAETKRFELDAFHGEAATQADVFASIAGLGDDLVAGFNACLLAYGQTGSGKTHTMQGAGPQAEAETTAPTDDSGRGLVPRLLESVFESLAALQSMGDVTAVTATATAVEIYMEKCSDLLSPGEGPAVELTLRGNSGSFFVEGAREVTVASAPAAIGLYAASCRRRAVGSTEMNATSSRSHSLFILRLKLTRHVAGGAIATTTSQLLCVDLAGSERLKSTGATGTGADEARNINKSLLQLGIVMRQLGDPACPVVSFRDSALTKLLQPALSGAARAALVVTVSPGSTSALESAASLHLAEDAHRVVGAAAAGIAIVSAAGGLHASATQMAHLHTALAEALKARAAAEATLRVMRADLVSARAAAAVPLSSAADALATALADADAARHAACMAADATELAVLRCCAAEECASRAIEEARRQSVELSAAWSKVTAAGEREDRAVVAAAAAADAAARSDARAIAAESTTSASAAALVAARHAAAMAESSVAAAVVRESRLVADLSALRESTAGLQGALGEAQLAAVEARRVGAAAAREAAAALASTRAEAAAMRSQAEVTGRDMARLREQMVELQMRCESLEREATTAREAAHAAEEAGATAAAAAAFDLAAARAAIEAATAGGVAAAVARDAAVADRVRDCARQRAIAQAATAQAQAATAALADARQAFEDNRAGGVWGDGGGDSDAPTPSDRRPFAAVQPGGGAPHPRPPSSRKAGNHTKAGAGPGVPPLMASASPGWKGRREGSEDVTAAGSGLTPVIVAQAGTSIMAKIVELNRLRAGGGDGLPSAPPPSEERPQGKRTRRE